MNTIARIQTDFLSKFGIPRQSGLIETEGRIVFETAYRDPVAVRGLEGFSHLWLIWLFSETAPKSWSPTVRPPRLGGTQRMGVFATRSPFRPNPIGLSAVELQRIEIDSELGPVLYVRGADLMNNTPILDIKPYLAYTDSRPEALGGFSDTCRSALLEVIFPEQWLSQVPEHQRQALTAVLAQDPRPRYQKDPERVYAFEFGACHIRFQVKYQTLLVCYVSLL